MDKLDFLEGASPDATAAPVAEIEPTPEGPARGPDGRFASAASDEPAPTPDPATEAEPAPVVAAEPTTPPPGYVPVGVVQELRQEIRALKQTPPVPQAPPPRAPDRWEDPEGYDAFQQANYQQVALNVKLDLSEDMTRGRHGDELVDAAKQWALERFAQSPALHQEVLSQRNPYEYAVKLYKQEQAFQKLGDGDLDQFLAWKAQQANPLAPAPTANAPAQPPSMPAARPPPSLAAAPSAGGAAHVPTGPGQAFGRAFG